MLLHNLNFDENYINVSQKVSTVSNPILTVKSFLSFFLKAFSN
jgi:hypothetical protein